jgi:hypothetical protein
MALGDAVARADLARDGVRERLLSSTGGAVAVLYALAEPATILANDENSVRVEAAQLPDDPLGIG